MSSQRLLDTFDTRNKFSPMDRYSAIGATMSRDAPYNTTPANFSPPPPQKCDTPFPCKAHEVQWCLLVVGHSLQNPTTSSATRVIRPASHEGRVGISGGPLRDSVPLPTIRVEVNFKQVPQGEIRLPCWHLLLQVIFLADVKSVGVSIF